MAVCDTGQSVSTAVSMREDEEHNIPTTDIGMTARSPERDQHEHGPATKSDIMLTGLRLHDAKGGRRG